ncbi:MAG: MFS transporter [Alphaproteobacteria bacterium]|nr:MAG: MFS transporter [Alphaproteobacteria bacterium]
MAGQKPSEARWAGFLGYGSGDFALNLFWQGTGFYLFYFYTNVMGIQGTLVGTIFLLGSIWDAVSDPMMGYIAERTNTRWGSYRPYLLFGAIPLALSFLLLFLPVHFDGQAAQVAYLLAMLLLFRTCYTVVSIPYSALGARVTRDSDMRTRLAGVRMYCGFLGGIFISTFAKWLQENFPDSEAFSLMGAGAGVVSVLVLVVCFKLTRERHTSFDDIPLPANAGDVLRSVASNRPFLMLIGGIALVTVANTVVGQTMLYYFEYHLGDRNPGNTAIMIMMIAPMVTIPMWSAAALKFGKRNSWIAGSLIASLGLLLLYADESGSTTLALVEVSILTLGLSAYAVLFWSMLPDTIEYGEHQSAIRNESFLIGLASSFQKISIGLSAFALGLLLDYIGYDPAIKQSESTLEGIKAIFAIIPGSALMLSAAMILYYPISARLHGQIVAAIRSRAGESPDQTVDQSAE